jgi:hypothetical protein
MEFISMAWSNFQQQAKNQIFDKCSVAFWNTNSRKTDLIS